MGRTSWRVMWGLVAALTAVGPVSTALNASRSGHAVLPSAFVLDVMMNGPVWLAVLFPLFCLGAWLRNRAPRPTASGSSISTPVGTQSDAAPLKPEGQEPTRPMQAPLPPMPAPTARPDWVPLGRALAYVVLVAFAAGATLTLVFAALTKPHARSSSGPPQAELTVDDKLELERMLTSVMQDPDTLGDVKPRFWQWADSHGGLSDEGLDEFRTTMHTGLRVSRLFWEEALVSLQRGRPFKSTEREQLENDLIGQGKMSDFQRRQNEANMERIAVGQPIALGGGEKVVVTEELARAVLADFDRKEQAVTALLTRPAD